MENTPADTLCVRKESGFLDRNALKYIVIVTMWHGDLKAVFH